MGREMIYLDCNATTPIDPGVVRAMQPLLTGGFGNPSSAHRLGREARQALEAARGQIAGCLRIHGNRPPAGRRPAETSHHTAARPR